MIPYKGCKACHVQGKIGQKRRSSLGSLRKTNEKHSQKWKAECLFLMKVEGRMSFLTRGEGAAWALVSQCIIIIIIVVDHQKLIKNFIFII